MHSIKVFHILEVDIDFTSTIPEKCLLQRDVLIKHNCVPTLSYHTKILFAEHSINKFNVNNLIQDVYIFIYIN